MEVQKSAGDHRGLCVGARVGSFSTTSLILLFQHHETLEVVGCAATLAEALLFTQAHPVDLGFVALERCDPVDLPLVRGLRTHLPGLPLVTLTTHLDLATRTRLLATGAQAHLTTAISEAELGVRSLPVLI